MECPSSSDTPDFAESLHALLEQEHANELRHIVEDELIDVTLLRIEEALISSQVPFLFDKNMSEMDLNKHLYVADRLTYLNDFYPLTSEEYLAAERKSQAEAELMAQEEESMIRQIITSTVMQNRAIAAGEDIGDDKKVIMATIIVLGRDEGWLDVVDTVLAGEPLNRFAESDMHYIEDIERELANFGSSERGKAILSISAALGVPPENDTEIVFGRNFSADDIHKIGLAAYLTTITKTEANSEQHAIALIDSNAREILREFGYDPQAQQQVSSTLIDLYHSEKAST